MAFPGLVSPLAGLLGLMWLGVAPACSSDGISPAADLRGSHDRPARADGPSSDSISSAPLGGVWALKATVRAKAQVLGTPTDVTSVLLLRAAFDEQAGEVAMTTRACDIQVPQVNGL